MLVTSLVLKHLQQSRYISAALEIWVFYVHATAPRASVKAPKPCAGHKLFSARAETASRTVYLLRLLPRAAHSSAHSRLPTTPIQALAPPSALPYLFRRAFRRFPSLPMPRRYLLHLPLVAAAPRAHQSSDEQCPAAHYRSAPTRCLTKTLARYVLLQVHIFYMNLVHVVSSFYTRA